MEAADFFTRCAQIGYFKSKVIADDIGVSKSTVDKWRQELRTIPRYALRWLLKMEHDARKPRK